MRIFRSGDGRHPLWGGTGAALVGGRWSSPGRPLIYGSSSDASAMLETLAHANTGRIPTTHRLVVAEVPEGVLVERREANALPAGWAGESAAPARSVGDRWLDESGSAILPVPSVVARLEWNALVNPLHPDAARLSLSAAEDVASDKRLFERPAGARR